MDKFYFSFSFKMIMGFSLLERELSTAEMKERILQRREQPEASERPFERPCEKCGGEVVCGYIPESGNPDYYESHWHFCLGCGNPNYDFVHVHAGTADENHAECSFCNYDWLGKHGK